MFNTNKKSKLAILGGRPIRGKKDPLPDVFPREIPTEEHLKLVREIDESGLNANGSVIERFKDAVKEAWGGVKYAVPATNCTAIVHVAIAALDCEPGDEIIVNAISDYGSVSWLPQNVTPVFADVDLRTGLPTGEDIEKVITDRTRGIVVANFYGQVCDMDSIMQVSKKYNIPVIEDVCQSPLVKYRGRISGTIGFAGTPSFSPEKVLSTNGGGMLITNDEKFAELVDIYANRRGVDKMIPGFGRVHSRIGYNYRYDGYRAALGIAMLKVFPERLKRRMEKAESLNDRLSQIDGITPCRSLDKEAEHGYWLYAFRVEPDRFDCTADEFAEALVAEGMPQDCSTARYYLLPETMAFLHRGNREYEKLVKVNPRIAEREYSGDMTPKAKAHLERAVRWGWTHKYSQKDIDDIYGMIEKVALHYRR